MLSSGAAALVSKTSAPLTEGWSNSWGFEWAGKDPNDKTVFNRFTADEDIVATAGFTLLQGRDFNLKEYSTDSTAILLNESAVKAMNLKEPVGQMIKDNRIDWHVVGVIKDFILQSPFQPKNFHFRSLQQPIKPLSMRIGPEGSNLVSINVSAANLPATIAAIENKWKTLIPNRPFSYYFLDDFFDKQYKGEERFGKLFLNFAVLAIIISSLGLLGLMSYSTLQRTKEIGIRKVLGASLSGIVNLLSLDFLKLVIISFAIAAPLAWYFMYKWLRDFAYHTNVGFWVFVLAGFCALAIALLTVSFQAIKAAIANPVKSLRTE